VRGDGDEQFRLFLAIETRGILSRGDEAVSQGGVRVAKRSEEVLVNLDQARALIKVLEPQTEA